MVSQMSSPIGQAARAAAGRDPDGKLKRLKPAPPIRLDAMRRCLGRRVMLRSYSGRTRGLAREAIEVHSIRWPAVRVS